MTFQLPTQEEKAGYVKNQFDRIAAKYDLANDLISLGMHRLWKKRAIEKLLGDSKLLLSKEGQKGPADESRFSYREGKQSAANGAPVNELGGKPAQAERIYLDLCTGTGDLAMLLSEKLGPEDQVIGLDFSPNMLQVARRRQEHKNKNTGAGLTWKEGDALTLPFADNTFDGAIISFGLRNLSDIQQGLNEMARVVKPGCRVVNLDLGQPETPIFTPLFLFFFENIVPLIGEIIQQDRQAYTYLPESRKNYPHPRLLSEMFENAGMWQVEWWPLALGSVALHVGKVR